MRTTQQKQSGSVPAEQFPQSLTGVGQTNKHLAVSQLQQHLLHLTTINRNLLSFSATLLSATISLNRTFGPSSSVSLSCRLLDVGGT
jgi:hypothetical protein